MTAKEAVMDVLKHAPADITYEEIRYRLFIREKLEAGLQAVDNNDLVSPEEIEAEIRRWSIG